MTIFNLVGIDLSTLEKDVLSRGLSFGIPQKTAREEILAEFEVLHQQLNNTKQHLKARRTPAGQNWPAAPKRSLAAKPDRQGFPLNASYFRTIQSLKQNVITRPEKGQGVVYNEKSVLPAEDVSHSP